MKKVILALLATSTLAMAAPAFAHDDDDDDAWGAVPTYEVFQQQYQHIWEGIQHGLSDGSFTRGEANYFYRQLRNIQARANWDMRRGYYNPDWTEAQLQNLHERMHIAHERGHERLNNDWNRESYGYRNYNPYSPYTPYSPYSYNYQR